MHLSLIFARHSVAANERREGGERETRNIWISESQLVCTIDLSDVLLLDGEAQRALPAKGHGRVEVSYSQIIRSAATQRGASKTRCGRRWTTNRRLYALARKACERGSGDVGRLSVHY